MACDAWQPVLCGRTRDAALAAARDVIAAEVECGPQGDCTLEADGGAALLLAFAENAAAEARLAAMLDATQACSGRQLWGGTTGAAWVVAHCVEPGDASDVLEALAKDLVRILEVPRWEQHFDLIGGLAGYGVFAVELSAHRPDLASAIARRVVDHLEALVTESPSGMALHTPAHLLPAWQRHESPRGHVDVGIAHGSPGVIGVLARFMSAQLEVSRSRRLLDGLARWMVACVPPREGGRFPAHLSVGAEPGPAARLGWCYGDLGVAVALACAGEALQDRSYVVEAIAIARGAAMRSFDDSGIQDAAICHGAAGVAHLFNRLYQATEEPDLAAAAHRWLETVLAMRQPGSPFAGFPAARRDPITRKLTWVSDRGLLQGSTGVALVLLAAATDIAPTWDRLLLADLPLR
jgi:hypothetical protein